MIVYVVVMNSAFLIILKAV